jgi:hypothetical protein
MVLRCAHAKKSLQLAKEVQRGFFKGDARKAGAAHFGEGHRQARAAAADAPEAVNASQGNRLCPSPLRRSLPLACRQAGHVVLPRLTLRSSQARETARLALDLICKGRKSGVGCA